MIIINNIYHAQTEASSVMPVESVTAIGGPTRKFVLMRIGVVLFGGRDADFVLIGFKFGFPD